MRVISWMGCVSGRLGFHSDSFSGGSIAISDCDGHAVGEFDDTRLPSERLGWNRPILKPQPAPLLYTKPKRLLAGASV